MMFSWLSAPQRHARIGRGQNLADDFLRGQVGVDGAHLGAVDHHLRDAEIFQIEKAAQHVALNLRDAALLVQQVELVAQLLIGRENRRILAEIEAEGQQHEPDHALDADGDRAENGHDPRHRPREIKRDAVRVSRSRWPSAASRRRRWPARMTPIVA